MHVHQGHCKYHAHGSCDLQELCKRAEDMGIKWGLEVINRYESNVCNTGLRVSLQDLRLCLQCQASLQQSCSYF